MKKYILQHCTVEQAGILALSSPLNKAYCEKNGYEYTVSDMVRKSPDQPFEFEKMGYLKEVLPKLEEDSLVVWLDSDSIIVRTDEDFANAIQPQQIFGAVRCLHGVDMKEHNNWWNVGTLVLRNCPIVRDFINRISLRKDSKNDEIAMMKELKENGFMLGEGHTITSIDNKWNVWKNNKHVCKNPVVVSFHGYKGNESKLAELKNHIATLGVK